MHHVESGLLLEEFSGEVTRAAYPARPISDPSGIRLDECDEFRKRIRRDRRMNDEHEIQHRDKADRNQICRRMERNLGVGQRSDRKRSHGTEKHGVAVRGRLRDILRCDYSAGTPAVLNDDGLPEAASKFIGQYARDTVAFAPGEKADHESNGSCGIPTGFFGMARPHRKKRDCQPKSKQSTA